MSHVRTSAALLSAARRRFRSALSLLIFIGSVSHLSSAPLSRELPYHCPFLRNSPLTIYNRAVDKYKSLWDRGPTEHVRDIDVIGRQALLVALPHARETFLGVGHPALRVEEREAVPVRLQLGSKVHVSFLVHGQRHGQLLVLLRRRAHELL